MKNQTFTEATKMLIKAKADELRPALEAKGYGRASYRFRDNERVIMHMERDYMEWQVIMDLTGTVAKLLEQMQWMDEDFECEMRMDAEWDMREEGEE